ncbi:MAG TPA: PTS sugar transporter subunit IIA [Kofleriaceae bacterium]|nr:PTS sugar transporter subunit IIA [Kofleriaceae bacterium]
MKIVELIRRDTIVPELLSTDKAGIIRELAGAVAAHYEVPERALTQILIDRENLASTAIGEGVAIPHGKMSRLGQLLACLGRAPEGVDFDSMDGEPTYLFFVLVAPESSTGAHLKALARISRVFKDRALRDRLLAAATADEMYDIIAEEDAKY